MDDAIVGEWKKELRVLLDQLQSRPSDDQAERRDRINVLNALIAGRTMAAA